MFEDFQFICSSSGCGSWGFSLFLDLRWWWLFSLFAGWVTLLFSNILLLFRLVLITLFTSFSTVWMFFFLISMLSVFLWRSSLIVSTLIVLLTLVLVTLWSLLVSLVLLNHLLLIDLSLNLRSLDKHLSWWLPIELKAWNLSLHSNWSWTKIFVWIKSAKSGHLSKACNLDKRRRLGVQWTELEWAHWRRSCSCSYSLVLSIVVILRIVVIVVIIFSFRISNLFRHWW